MACKVAVSYTHLDVYKRQNVGLDLSIFGRVGLTFDYYIKNTSNLLTPVTLPPSAGFSSYTENLGKSQNKGFELQASVRAINNSDQDLHLNVFASLMHNTNKIKEINEALSCLLYTSRCV